MKKSAKELSSGIKTLQKMIGKSPGELPPKVSLPGPNPSFPGGLDVNWKCPHAPFLQDSIHQVFAESARGYLNS
ncbi:unknown [Alistipes sp. CAG:831]|nr:unknown [Alistipes sp. CAG:831]